MTLSSQGEAGEMTKGELRKARQAARAEGRPLSGELRLPADERSDRDQRQACEFTESRRGRRALDRWARAYDALNGAPENEYDR